MFEYKKIEAKILSKTQFGQVIYPIGINELNEEAKKGWRVIAVNFDATNEITSALLEREIDESKIDS